MRKRCLILALGLAAGGCLNPNPTVVRVVDGEETEGRWISPAAYEEYVRGAYHEARNETEQAVDAYQRAVEQDPASPELWTRIGALRCRAGVESDGAFERAHRLDPEYAPLWLERARCHKRRGQLAQALESAERAAALDPDALATTLLIADYQVASGHPEVASRWLEAWVLREPGTIVAWKTLYALARERRDAPLAERAAEVLTELLPPLRHNPADPKARNQAELDRALAEGDLKAARRAAVALRVRPGELAVLAARRGADDTARAQARLVLAADPENVDAWVALVVVADLAGDHAGVQAALAKPPPVSWPPSALAAALLGELLERRVGTGAAQAWREAYEASVAGRDAAP
jgi:tetratricopeptide (TPR) repeat protein